MLKVLVAQNPMEAHLVVGILEAAGIPAELRGEALFTTIQGGSAMPGVLPTVWIFQDDQAPEARALVERFAHGKAQPGPVLAPWSCGCGERHEGQFTACWKCGAAQP